MATAVAGAGLRLADCRATREAEAFATAVGAADDEFRLVSVATCVLGVGVGSAIFIRADEFGFALRATSLAAAETVGLDAAFGVTAGATALAIVATSGRDVVRVR